MTNFNLVFIKLVWTLVIGLYYLHLTVVGIPKQMLTKDHIQYNILLQNIEGYKKILEHAPLEYFRGKK